MNKRGAFFFLLFPRQSRGLQTFICQWQKTQEVLQTLEAQRSGWLLESCVGHGGYFGVTPGNPAGRLSIRLSQTRQRWEALQHLLRRWLAAVFLFVLGFAVYYTKALFFSSSVWTQLITLYSLSIVSHSEWRDAGWAAAILIMAPSYSGLWTVWFCKLWKRLKPCHTNTGISLALRIWYLLKN